MAAHGVDDGTAGSGGDPGGSLREVIRYIPDGTSIPTEMWDRRHRNILITIAVQIPLLFGLGLYQGTLPVLEAEIPAIPTWMLLLMAGGVGVPAVVAALPRLGRRQRTTAAAFSGMTISMALVKFSGGYIEAHFHFFVFVAVLALYEDWLPFAVGMGYVAVGHGTFSLIDSSLVYNHAAAIQNPIAWGGVHAGFITLLAGTLMVNWYSIEKSREEAEEKLALAEAKQEEVEDAEAAKATAEERKREVESLNDHLESKADDYSAAMNRAADGDLTVRLDADSESEAMERIGTAFNEMLDEIGATMGRVQSFADDVSRASETVRESTADAEEMSEAVTESVEDIAADADEQREMLTEVSSEMSNLSATIEEVASSTETVAEAAEETSDVAEAGQRSAEGAMDRVEDSQEATETTVAKVRSLDERMSDIGEIVDLIADIAEQTNILALNANIEAARTGSGDGSAGGDGFAVVADEVKQLAGETQDAAKEIEELIAATQSETTETVETVREAERHMSDSATAVRDAVEAFGSVATHAADTDDGIQEISHATDEQAASTEEAVTMVEEVEGISRSTATEANDVVDTAAEQHAAMSAVTEEAGALSSEADRLQDLLGGFTVERSGGASPSATGGHDRVAGDGGI